MSQVNGRIKGTIIEVGSADDTLTGWVFNGNGGSGIEYDIEDNEIYLCGYTAAELKEIAQGVPCLKSAP